MKDSAIKQDVKHEKGVSGFSGYIDLFDCLYNFFINRKYSRENKNSENLHFFQSFYNDFTHSKQNISSVDLISVAILIILLFALRKLLCNFTKYVITDKLQYNNKDSERLKESLWKLLFYSFSSLILIYICIIKEGAQYFIYPDRLWTNYSANNSSIDALENAVYIFQIAFYTYSMYATLFEDEWRKDSPVLLIHHVICTILLVLSSVTRTHRSGILVLFLHDPCDVALEITKILMVIKVHDGKVIKSIDRATSVSFVIFTAVWITNRLYHYPITLMYFTMRYNMEHDLNVPFYGIINTLLTIILAMNFYWFTFIMKLAIKMILNDDPAGLVDIREYDKQNNKLSCFKPLNHEDTEHTEDGPTFTETQVPDKKLHPLQEEDEFEHVESKFFNDMNNNSMLSKYTTGGDHFN